MQFRDLQKQYNILKKEIDDAIQKVLAKADFISGQAVTELEERLAQYTGVKHCITCGNGTDALTLALMAWNIGVGDAVFVPDFTFFASAETIAFEGAAPIFVDVEKDTFNICPASLEKAIRNTLADGKYTPKAIISVDLFGLPANYPAIRSIAQKYGLFLLEDSAQAFGGSINGALTCSFGDISTTSFFPAKPLGCYGDGGAIFTNNDTWAQLIRSFKVHGKGNDKYDNIQVGLNSRLDTIQAAVLLAKFEAFTKYELAEVNRIAEQYTDKLNQIVVTPKIKEGYYSSWAQYTVLTEGKEQRKQLQEYLKVNGIPTMIYYPKTMSQQTAFQQTDTGKENLEVSHILAERVLSLPIHPYLSQDEQIYIIDSILTFYHSIYKS